MCRDDDRNAFKTRAQVYITGEVTLVGGAPAVWCGLPGQNSIGHSNNLLDRCRSELDQHNIEFERKKTLIAQLTSALEIAQKIVSRAADCQMLASIRIETIKLGLSMLIGASELSQCCGKSLRRRVIASPKPWHRIKNWGAMSGWL